MSESKELIFSKQDQDMYGKLHAAIYDLGSAYSYGGFILKKGWKAKPWSRGKVYLQQSAFVTSMVVSYCRAFNKSDGWPRFPKELLEVYTAEERTVHLWMLEKRDKIYAHSDSVNCSVRPWNSKWHGDIEGVPIREVDHAMILALQEMCMKIIPLIRDRRKEIKLKYLASHENSGT